MFGFVSDIVSGVVGGAGDLIGGAVDAFSSLGDTVGTAGNLLKPLISAGIGAGKETLSSSGGSGGSSSRSSASPLDILAGEYGSKLLSGQGTQREPLSYGTRQGSRPTDAIVGKLYEDHEKSMNKFYHKISAIAAEKGGSVRARKERMSS